MAFTGGGQDRFPFIAGTTFSTGDLYKGVVINSSGHVVVPATTDVSGLVIGTLYSNTATTSGAGVETVTVELGRIVKVNMAASTLATSGSVAFSTAGLGIAPTTDATIWGVIAQGSSGSAGRIATVVRTNG